MRNRNETQINFEMIKQMYRSKQNNTSKHRNISWISIYIKKKKEATINGRNKSKETNR